MQRGWSASEAAEPADSVERSVWLRDVRAAQVARAWAGTQTPSHPVPLGMVRWAGEGQTPEQGMRAVDLLGSDWLDRVYGPRSPVDPGSSVDPGVPECDLGSLSRPIRRYGVPAHAANNPGRFRELVQGQPADRSTAGGYVIVGDSTRRSWPVKSLVVPIAVVVGLTGFGVGHTVLETVGPQDDRIALADPPLLTGQKGVGGVLVSVTPKATTTPTTGAFTTGGSTTGGRHRAADSAPSAAAATDSPAAPTGTPTSSNSATSSPTRGGYGAAATPTPEDSQEDQKTKATKSRSARRGARHRKAGTVKSATCNSNATGRAGVSGEDVYKLDSTGNGWACESYRR